VTDHIPHPAEWLWLDCPRCLAQWEVIRATQADPLTVWPESHTLEARRMPDPAILIAIAALVAVVAVLLVWSDRQAPR
jgi:hypothetical protein